MNSPPGIYQNIDQDSVVRQFDREGARPVAKKTGGGRRKKKTRRRRKCGRKRKFTRYKKHISGRLKIKKKLLVRLRKRRTRKKRGGWAIPHTKKYKAIKLLKQEEGWVDDFSQKLFNRYTQVSSLKDAAVIIREKLMICPRERGESFDNWVRRLAQLEGK